MNTITRLAHRGRGVAITALLGAFTTCASAAEFFLVATPLTKDLPGGVGVPAWGYALDADGNYATTADQGAATLPGPVLRVGAAETTITIHVQNRLPEPTSLVVPGLTAALSPTFVNASFPTIVTSTGARNAGDVRSVVRSFAAEAGPNGGIVTYTLVARAGTYLYRSGTHPSVQVPMGLYGALVVEGAVGEPYPGVAAANEAIVLFSEIDPALNGAVAAGTYGTGALTSTVNYRPTWFLINGAPHPVGAALVDHDLVTGERTIVRLLNAGLQSRVPTLLGLEFDLVAEDGRLLPYAHRQYSMHLAAGQTRDAVIVPAAPGVYPLFDRMLALTNGTVAGGMQTSLFVGLPLDSPVAYDDTGYLASEDTLLSVAGPGVLENDDPVADLEAVLVSGPRSALAFELLADGSFSYTPAPDFAGSDTFTYRARSLTTLLESNVASVVITVAGIPDAPVATADAYTVDESHVLDVPAPGVLANDRDADGDALSAVLDAAPAHGAVTLADDGSFVYRPELNYSGADAFTYHAAANGDASAPVSVAITVRPAPNTAPVANPDVAITRRDAPVAIPVLANDTDVDGVLVPGTVTVVTPPRRGTVTVDASGVVTYQLTPQNRNFRGTDSFRYTVRDDDGAVSNAALVNVNVAR